MESNPEERYPVVKDPTLVRAAQLACLRLLHCLPEHDQTEFVAKMYSSLEERFNSLLKTRILHLATELRASFSCIRCIHSNSKLRLKSDSISETQQIIFPTCLLQVLLSYLVSRLSGESFIVHRVNIQVNATTVDLDFSTAMDRHVLNSKTTPQAARGCGIRR